MKKYILFFVCRLISAQFIESVDVNVIQSFISSLRLSCISHDEAATIAQCCVTYGNKFNVDPLLITSLIYRESTFNPQAVSTSGAKGLGQIKAINFADLAITDPFNIEQNIRGTAQYLKYMFSLWLDHPQQIEFALASYFNGYTGLKRQMNSNNTISKVTSGYVHDILAKYDELKILKNQIKIF